MSLPAHVLLADHSGKAWGCTEALEDSPPSRCYCNHTSNPCQSAEADRAAYPCTQDPLVCVAPTLEVSRHHVQNENSGIRPFLLLTLSFEYQSFLLLLKSLRGPQMLVFKPPQKHGLEKHKTHPHLALGRCPSGCWRELQKSLFSEHHQDQRELGLSSAEQTAVA